MGMSSSQARLLTLTARMHDIEWRTQKIEADKLRLANDSRHAYEDYLKALDAKKIQYRTLQNDGTVTFKDATPNILQNAIIPGYSGEHSNDILFLQNQNGKVMVTEAVANHFHLNSLSVDSDLDTYIPSVVPGATKTKVEFTPVINTSYKEYVAPENIYSPASNGVQSIEDKLVSGTTYMIRTAEDLAHFAELSTRFSTKNVTAVLANDINMLDPKNTRSFASIKNFEGTFNGNGYKISNLDTSLFDHLEGATVQKIELVGSGNTVNAQGALANTADGVTIDDIKVSNYVISYSGNNVGGLIGSVDNSKDDGKHIHNCIFNGTVTGEQYVGGLVGSVSRTEILYSSTDGSTINGVRACGGFIGGADTEVKVQGTARDCTIYVDDSSSPAGVGPDSGGFIGTCGGGEFVSCFASGNLIDSTTNALYKPTVCSGFMGFAGDGGTVEIRDSYSSTNVSTQSVQAVGFASANNHGTLILNNCHYTGTLSSVDAGYYSAFPNYGFACVGPYTDPSTANSIVINGGANSCSTSVTTCNKDNIGATNVVVDTAYVIPTDPEFYHAADLTHDTLPEGTNVSVLGTEIASIPNIDTTSSTNPGGYYSNILAALIKAGEYDPDTNTPSSIPAQIKNFLSNNFEDNNTDNSKLWHLNKYLVNYLNSPEGSNKFTADLLDDITSGISNKTEAYQNIGTLLDVARESDDSTWTIGKTDAKIGKLTIPNVSTIEKSVVAAFQRAGFSTGETAISNFISKYDTSDNTDRAYLANINDIIREYCSTENKAVLTNLKNIIDGGTSRMEELPSYIDNADHYDITMKDSEDDLHIVKTWDTSIPEIANAIAMWNLGQRGIEIIEEPLASNSEYLHNLLECGEAVLTEFDPKGAVKLQGMSAEEIITMTDEEYNSIMGIENTSVAIRTSVQEVQDEKELRKAEAKYEAEMRNIDRKDRQYDTKLAACETERNAIKQEMDTLKTVSKDNCERTFKLFS